MGKISKNWFDQKIFNFISRTKNSDRMKLPKKYTQSKKFSNENLTKTIFKNENEWEIIIKWVIVVFDWVFFCWRVIYQFAKIVNGKLGTHSCHSTGCLHRGIILFCLNSWERRMQLRTSWFMLRMPPWCRKSQFREKNYVCPPYQLN